MSARLIGWCPHPTRHRNCTKVGCKPTHPKGKRAVRKKLAKYMETQYRRLIGGARIIIKEDDYLCTGCYNFENNKMNKNMAFYQLHRMILWKRMMLMILNFPLI